MGLSSDPERRAAQLANLVKGQSSDPAVAARQRRGLSPGRQVHGAYAAARRQPLEDEHRTRLAAQFPGAIDTPAGQDLVNAAAKRAAMLDLFGAWLSDNGPIVMRGRTVEVTAPARELRHLLDAHERAVFQLAALEREHGHGGVPSLEDYLAQRALAAGQADGEANR